jgi:hypothetical protein
MHPRRLAGLVVVALVTACDPSATVITGISHEGGTTQDVLVFSSQPPGAVAGEIMTPAITVVARDTLGNTDATFAGNVTVILAGNTGGASLDGTKTVAAVSGVARFGDLSVDRVGSGFLLVASAPGATSTTSAAFEIVAPTP